MKKLTMAAALLALALAASPAGAVSVGVGAYGGASIPVLQDDTGQGSIFGLRVPVNLLPMITVEPYYSSSSGGDTEETFDDIAYTRSGMDVTAFGANVLFTFGTGVQLIPFLGLGTHEISREGSEDLSEMGYNFGLGLAFAPPVAGLSIHLRGELNAVVTDDDETSRKWGNITAGVSYNLFKTP